MSLDSGCVNVLTAINYDANSFSIGFLCRKIIFVISKSRIRLEIKLQEPTIAFSLGCFPSSGILNQPLSITTLKTTVGRYKDKFKNIWIGIIYIYLGQKGNKNNYSHSYWFVTAHVHVHVPERVVPVHVPWLESQSLNYGCGNFWRLSNDLNKQMPPTYEIDSQHIFRPQHHATYAFTGNFKNQISKHPPVIAVVGNWTVRNCRVCKRTTGETAVRMMTSNFFSRVFFL